MLFFSPVDQLKIPHQKLILDLSADKITAVYGVRRVLSTDFSFTFIECCRV